MADRNHDPDVRAIRDLIERQFASMSWKEGGSPDWPAFRADFLPDAQLYPSARPVQRRAVDEFAERMRGLVGTTLRSFDEQVVGAMVRVFGNVAVAAVGCENVENGAETNRNVEMMLLIKDGGHWRIAAQAWDRETDARAMPAGLWD